VARWPWAKRLFYANCYDALEPDHDDVDVGDYDVDVDGMPSGAPDGVPSGVSKHDTVITT
jgi:hypothetical protein